jgi:hypothetical protein
MAFMLSSMQERSRRLREKRILSERVPGLPKD